jgi:hypothetical protein
MNKPHFDKCGKPRMSDGSQIEYLWDLGQLCRQFGMMGIYPNVPPLIKIR